MANKASGVYQGLNRINEKEARINIDLAQKILPLALSIELPGGYVSEVIPAGVQLPIDTTKMFSTANSFQLAAEFNVLLGNRPLACDNYELCRIRVRNIKWSGAGVPQIELRFKISESGLVVISAENHDHDNAEILVFMACDEITSKEVECALLHAKEYEESDRKISDLIQKSLDCYALIGATNDFYSAAKRKLGFVGKREYKQARKRLQDALAVEPARATSQTISELDEAEKAFRGQRQKIIPLYKQVMAWYD